MSSVLPALVCAAISPAIPASPHTSASAAVRMATTNGSVHPGTLTVVVTLRRRERTQKFRAALVQLEHAVVGRSERLALQRARAVGADFRDDVADVGGFDEREDPFPVEIAGADGDRRLAWLEVLHVN